MAISKLAAKYKSHERRYSSAALIGGFIFDILTLRRPDTLWENSWIMMYLVIAAATILYFARREKSESVESSRLHFWFRFLMQFAFGGLLSAFLILYFRSATLSVSWPFLLILALAFAANERLKGYHDRLVFQIAFLYLSLLSFAIFAVPVLVRSIGPYIFVLSGLLSLIAIRLFLRLLERVSLKDFDDYKRSVYTAIWAIFVTMNIFYFLNIIPPIPLSLKEGAIYYSVTRLPNGEYSIEKPDLTLADRLHPYPSVEIAGSEQVVYAYTAIFSPAKINTGISHQWQRFDEESDEWVTEGRIGLNVSGGRAEGFRTYSTFAVTPGKWRVSVLTSGGQALGRIGFRAVVADER